MNITIRRRRATPSAAIALLLLMGAVTAPVPASAAPLVFTDGFESGSLGAWTMVRGVTPDAGAHDGAWGARATGVAGPAWAYVALPATYPELFARTWFSVTSTSSPVTLLRFRNAHGGVQIAAGISKSGLLTVQNSRTGVTVTSTVVVTSGVWHEVQIHALMAKGTAGRFDVWFDGAPVPELSGVQKVGPTPVGRVQIGDNVARTFDVNFDDVAVDTAFIDQAPPIDTDPPTEPVISGTTALSSATVRITWSASTDDVGVTGYDIFRSDAGGPFTAVGSTTGATSFVDPTVQPDADYAYKVDAFDAAGHHSSRSDPSSVHTPLDTPTPPNVVLIVTDDQRYDMLAHMANVQQDLIDKGVTFSNGFVSDSLCCPSRTSTLRGQYSHTTGVYDIDGPYGGWPRVHSLNLESSTLATWLQADGYRTSLIGKYLNDYSDPTFVPPGWDFWRVSTGDSYFNYTISENGVSKRYGATRSNTRPRCCPTYADQFIRGTPASQPLFLDLAPSPHDPSTPEPKYATDPRCDGASETGSPAFDETDTKDKPFYVRHRPPLPADKVLDYGTTRPQMQCRALLSVDDMVSTVMTAMADTGRTNDTLFIYTSDNGLMNGDHRLPGKKAPYESSIRVPFIVRYDPMTAPGGTVDTHMVVNVDIAPTITDLVNLDVTPGCPVPAYSATCTGAFDGMSFLPLLNATPTDWRTSFLIEHYETASPGSVPPFCGVRTDSYKLVRYATGEEELYDLSVDPFELQNLMAGTLTTQQQTVHDELFQELFGPGGTGDLCARPPDYPLPPVP